MAGEKLVSPSYNIRLLLILEYRSVQAVLSPNERGMNIRLLSIRNPLIELNIDNESPLKAVMEH